MNCSRCNMSLDDWTPGCTTCRERRRLRARRSGDPNQLTRYHAEAKQSWRQAVQETWRRLRDGEIVNPLPERDPDGRWVAR